MKTIHVEASTYCNARCPLCPRSLYGYKVPGVYPEVHLSVSKFQECLKQFPDKTFVYFNGNLGDPMMNPNIIELTEQTNCRTSITTNGSIGTQKIWTELANRKVEAVFSVDGLEDTNHLYRQDVEWNKVMDRMKWFIGAGGNATWKFILFRHNVHQVKLVEELSQQLGFNKFQVDDHGRNYGPVLDKDANITHWILPHNKSLEPKPYYVKEGIERYKQTHANFFPEEKVYNINCEHEQDESVFIDAQGRIAPCCYQGFDLPDVPFIQLEDFSKLKETWATKKCNSVCVQSCGLK